MKEQPEDTGFNPELIFEEGRVAGEELASSALRESIEGQLEGLGLEQDEIEALFDPAPRRKGKHRRGKIHCSKRQRETMPQICKDKAYDPAAKKHHNWARVSGHYRRTFDPAPLREEVRRGGRKAKDLLTKLTKNEMAVGGVAGVGTFLALYNTRAGVLKTSGAKLKDGSAVDGMLKAIQYDFEQFEANGGFSAIPDRLQAAWKPILGYGLGGLVVRNVVAEYVPKNYKKLAVVIGDVMMGIAGGYTLKAGIDEADSKTIQRANTNAGAIRVVSPSAPAPAPIMNAPAYGVVNRY